MVDLDKAIGQLEADIKHADRIGALFVYIGRKQAKDVLDLLKEQEPVEPVLKREGKSKLYNDYECPVCGNNICYEQKYCSECGREMSWLAMQKELETTFEKDGHHIMCKSCGAYWCDMDREGDQYPQNFCPNCGKAAKWE